jgi:hypothetical protein
MEFYFREQKNQYLLQVFQDNEANLLRFVSTNLGLNTSYGIEFIVNKSISDFWNTYFLFTYFYNENGFQDLGSGAQLNNDIWTGHIRATNSFTFLKDKSLFADVTINYFSPTVNGNSRQDFFNQIGVAFRKTILNKNASISLAVEDIFNQGNLFNTRRYLNQDNTSSFRPENRLFILGFRYKFGNTRIKDNYKRKRVDERNRI